MWVACNLRSTLKPGNAHLCDRVPLRLTKLTGVGTANLGNCTALVRPPRPLPPALAPAPAPLFAQARHPAELNDAPCQ